MAHLNPDLRNSSTRAGCRFGNSRLNHQLWRTFQSDDVNLSQIKNHRENKIYFLRYFQIRFQNWLFGQCSIGHIELWFAEVTKVYLSHRHFYLAWCWINFEILFENISKNTMTINWSQIFNPILQVQKPSFESSNVTNVLRLRWLQQATSTMSSTSY